MRTPKVLGPLKKEERRNRKKAEEGRDPDMNGENVPEIGKRLNLEIKDTEPEENWIFPRSAITKEERKRLFGKELEVVIATTFLNHKYTSRNELYRQVKGGAIGLQLILVVMIIEMIVDILFW